jgi:WD40 repeat protein
MKKVRTGKEIRRIDVGNSYVVAILAFFPDGKKIATVRYDLTDDGKYLYSEDGKFRFFIEIWEVETGKKLQTLKGDVGDRWSNRNSTLVFSSDGKKIVGMPDGTIVNMWDAESGEVLKKLEATDRFVNSGFLSPDGKKVVSSHIVNDDQIIQQIIQVLDVESKKTLFVLPHAERLLFAAFSPDGTKIITEGKDNTAQIIDAESGKELQVLRSDPKDKIIADAFYSPDGRKIVTLGYGITRIWDAPSGKELHKINVGWKIPGGGGGPWVFLASFLPDGKQIITTYNDGIRIWDAETGKEVRKVVLQGLYRER